MENLVCLGSGKQERVNTKVEIDHIIFIRKLVTIVLVGVKASQQHHSHILGKLGCLVEKNGTFFLSNVRYDDLVEELLHVLDGGTVDLQETLGLACLTGL